MMFRRYGLIKPINNALLESYAWLTEKLIPDSIILFTVQSDSWI